EQHERGGRESQSREPGHDASPCSLSPKRMVWHARKRCQRAFRARHVVTSVAVVAALLCAMACAAPDSAPPPDTLVVALESAPAVLDPRFTTDANSSLVAALVSEGLTGDDERGEPAPALADWDRLSPTEYRFRIRPDARFADGTPVTAADVV